MDLRKLAAGLLLVVAVAGFWTWWRSDSRRIRARMNEIADLVDKAPGESQLAALDKARRIAGFFSSRFELRARPFDFDTRDRRELAAAIHSYRASSGNGSMRTSDVTLDVDSASRRATMFVTVRFGGAMRSLTGGNAYRFQINWLEEEGEWMVDYVDLLEVRDEPLPGL